MATALGGRMPVAVLYKNRLCETADLQPLARTGAGLGGHSERTRRSQCAIVGQAF